MNDSKQVMNVKEFEEYVIKAKFYYLFVPCYMNSITEIEKRTWVSSTEGQMKDIANMRPPRERVIASYDESTKSLWVG